MPALRLSSDRGAGYRQGFLTAAMIVFMLLGANNAAQAQTTQTPQQQEQAEQDNGQEGQPASGAGLAAKTGIAERSSAGESVSDIWAKSGFTGFIDVRQRLPEPKPELLDKGLRILTSDNFAPFNSRDEKGTPRGYHIEMAKLMCEELNIACTMKVVPFASIPDLLAEGEADIALAGLANQKALRDHIGFSMAYFQMPARFARHKKKFLRISPQALEDQPIAVIGRSAHEAYLKTYFPKVRRIPVADLDDAHKLLQEQKVVGLFADAVQISPFASGSNSDIVFAGQPYYDSHFFGSGMAVAYQKKQDGLGDLLNYGLLRLAQKGRLAELYARHFAIDIYTRY